MWDTYAVWVVWQIKHVSPLDTIIHTHHDSSLQTICKVHNYREML